MRVRCPMVIGRQAELDWLAAAVRGARAGVGAAVFVTGAAGVGKSALARVVVQVAQQQGVSAFVGRAVPRPSPVPYRALTEALLSADGGRGLPVDSELEPFRAALARLVPHWRGTGPSAGEDSSVVIGAGLLRLLKVWAPGGAVMVLEDLQWADPETLAVLEFVCDNIRGESLAVLGTLRDGEGPEAQSMLRAWWERGTAQLSTLAPLGATEVAQMVAACELPVGLDVDGAVELVATAEGVPLFVEELLSLASSPGSGRRVPESVAETVRLRLAGLDEPTLTVLGCAALLGRQFDWTVLPAAVGVDEVTVLSLLRRLVTAQLIDDDTAGFRFRHALVRDAVLAAMLTPQVARLAARTRAAVEESHPGLPGEWCVVAADLAEQAGESDTAASLLVVAGRRALQQAALGSAERLLRRAGTLTGVMDVRVASAELLAEVLADAGRVGEAADVVRDALAANDARARDPVWVARLRLMLARAGVAAEQWDFADEQLFDIRTVQAPDPGFSAEVAAVAAEVAIGRGDVEVARSLAAQAVAAAQTSSRPAAACQAWEVLGRAERLRSLRAAREAFTRAADIARENDLVLWRLRATHELGTIDLLAEGRVDTLEVARRLATRCGALTVAAALDVQLAAGYHLRGRPAESIESGLRAADAGRRLRVAGIQRAGACYAVLGHGLRGDLATLARLMPAAEVQAEGNPGLLSSLAGDGFGTCHLLTEDHPKAIAALERAAEVGAASADRIPSPWWGLWPLARAVFRADAQEALQQAAQVPVCAHNTFLHQFTAAVLLGEQGAGAEAQDMFDIADSAAPAGWLTQLARRLVAQAALEDGWGDPIGWLAEAAEFFDTFPARPVAVACRSLLRKAGAPRRSGTDQVPRELAERGITRREAEVLTLLGHGLSNRDMAGQLYLSPRTVEKHVENLSRKLGTGSRSELVAYAARRGIRTD